MSRTLFEIYRAPDEPMPFRVVYYTELDDQTRDVEIARAMVGESLYHGFLLDARKDVAKPRIESLLRRLNAGERVAPECIRQELLDVEAPPA